ncbi:MAG: DUF1552 domain-containing protein [Myxococcales bacterium]|nr:DUF1552 domain-containing protein [Myxococcales bacterium]
MTRPTDKHDLGPVYVARRRLFLKGLGGFALALPFLESLTPRGVEAQEAPKPKRFVTLFTHHGGIWSENAFPHESKAPNAASMLPGHDVHWGDLHLEAVGSDNQLSPLVRAPSDILTPTLAQKTMILRGLDMESWMGHGQGFVLGNNADSNLGDQDSLEPRPTIDQVMAYSPSFYRDLSSVTLRSMHLGQDWDGYFAFGYENPSSQSGAIIPMPTIKSSLALWSSIFPVDETQDESRPLIVDRVYESYHRLRSGAWGAASRLSSQDKSRLDDHMDRLLELERKLEAAASCSDLTAPTVDADDVGGEQQWELYNDVLVAAFVCGTSRIATIRAGSHWYPGFSGGDWHQEIAHMSDANPAPNQQEDILVASHRNWLVFQLMELANKLDAIEEGPGETFLDNSLLMFTSESGPMTHFNWEMPVVTFGGAGGWFQTGRYYDFRNRENTSHANSSNFLEAARRPGVRYNQWLANVLLSMDVPASEWERPGEKGYGSMSSFDGPLMQQASDPLPMVKA